MATENIKIHSKLAVVAELKEIQEQVTTALEGLDLFSQGTALVATIHKTETMKNVLQKAVKLEKVEMLVRLHLEVLAAVVLAILEEAEVQTFLLEEEDADSFLQSSKMANHRFPQIKVMVLQLFSQFFLLKHANADSHSFPLLL